jgi:hypothetical protein
MTTMTTTRSLLGVGALALALAGCTAQSQSTSQPAQGITGVAMTENAKEAPGAWSYIAQGVDLRKYTSFILEPPVVYRGEGADFHGLSDEEVQKIAQMFVDQTKAALGTKYPVVTRPGPHTARLKFTVVEVSTTVPYVSTATRIIPISAAINLVKGSTVGGGTLTGGVTSAVEASDSETGKVLAAAVRHLTPGAFDIEATLGTMDTAEAVAKEAATMLRARLDRLHEG